MSRIELEPKTDEPAHVAQQRLTTLVRELVHDRLPAGAQLTSEDAELDAKYGPLVFSQPNAHMADRLDELDCDPDLFAYNALTDVELDGKTATMSVTVSTQDLPTERCLRDEKVTAQPVCDVFTGAGGERAQARTEVLTGGDWVQNVVWVNKPDGTAIQFGAHNQVVIGGRPGWPQPPLSLDQIVEIALDPGMTLFP